MIGYATRFLAEVYAPLKDGLAAIDQRQIDSARVLGAGPLGEDAYRRHPGRHVLESPSHS